MHILSEEGFFEGATRAVVELGFGASGVTAESWFDRVRAHNERIVCVGVEVDPQRVASARAASRDVRTVWMEGGFDFASPVEGVGIVRALNVLRQYDASAAPGAHAMMGRKLIEGGLLVEGSCDRKGEVCVVHVMRKRGEVLVREALLCVVASGVHFAPRMLRDWLPQDLRRGVGMTHGVFADFLSVWMSCFEESVEMTGQARFVRSVALLSERAEGIESPGELVSRGAVLWRPARGVPHRQGE